MLSRFSLAALLAAGLVPLAPEADAQDQPPNVLFVGVDDLGTAVGFLSEEPANPLQWIFPDPVVRAQVRAVLTPNLDRLAASGVPFAQAHSAGTRCAPSRAALMTGVRPHTSEYLRNGDGHFRDNPTLGAVQTLPEYLRSQGYFTAGLGKVYHLWSIPTVGGVPLYDGPDTERSWDTWINARVGTDAPDQWSPWSTTNPMRMGVASQPLEETFDVDNAETIADILRTGRGTGIDEYYREGREIVLPSNQPFFLSLGIYRPHDPLVVPQELFDLLSPLNASNLGLTEDLRQAFEDDLGDLPPNAQAVVGYNGSDVTSGPVHDFYQNARSIDPQDGPVEAWRALVYHYLAGVMLADRAVGIVLDGLEAGPYADNTTVVLWGDHGWHLGEKSWFGKHTMWAAASHTTLIVRPASGVSAPGVLRQEPVSLMDIYPTLTTMAGVPTPGHVQGVDLAPMLAAPEASAGSTVLSSDSREDHALLSSPYRYIRYQNRSNVELYDLVADPREETNLANDPAYAAVRDSMDARLDRALNADFEPPSPPTSESTAWVNELHYDNAGSDRNEGMEIAGTAGLNLSGWTLSGYDSRGRLLRTLNLSQTLPDQGDGLGAFWIRIRDMPNSTLGVALVNPEGVIMQFLSYEGTVTASGGPADGATSQDIGVREGNGTAETESLQLVGAGVSLSDFSWTGPAPQSQGQLNAGQTVPPGLLPTVSGVPEVAALTFDLGGDEDETLTLEVSPNPIRTLGTARFTLPASGAVSLSVFDARGREVRQLATGQHPAGPHTFAWDAAGLAPGVYVVRLAASGEVRMQRAVVVR